MKRLFNTKNNGYGKILAVLLTVVASFALSTSAWAYDIDVLYIYHNGTDCGGYNFFVHVFNDNSDLMNQSMGSLGDGIYKIDVNKTNAKGFRFYKADQMQNNPGTYDHCYTPDARCGSGSNFWGESKQDIRYACYHTANGGWGLVPMYNISLGKDEGTAAVWGDGSEQYPFSVYGPDKIKVWCNASYIDNVGAQYQWKASWYSGWDVWDEYKSEDISIPASQYGIPFSVQCNTRTYNNGVNSAERTSPLMWFCADTYKRMARSFCWNGSQFQNDATGGTVKFAGGTDSYYVDYKQKWSVETEFIATPKSGYVFLGWFDNPNGTGTPLSLNQHYSVKNSSAVSSDFTIYALFIRSNDMPTVLVADSATVDNGPKVTLKGYLKKTGCDTGLESYGFYYCVKNGDNCSQVVSAGNILEQKGASLVLGQTWTGTIINGLRENTEYYYKPFVRSTNTGITTVSETCGTFITRGGCEYPVGDTIFYTIDASLAEADPCALQFTNIESALENLKSHNVNGAEDYWWDTTNSMLKKNIVFSVVPTKAGYGVSGERVDLSNINKFNDNVATVPTKEFIMRSSSSTTKPLIYGLNLTNSRKVTLDNIRVRRNAPSEDDGIGHSCILIGLDYDQNNLAVGKVNDAMLRIVNCVIEGDAFCCIHGQGIDGLYMENNNLIANCSNSSNNTKNWGASIKLMNSKNVIMLRNNFKGAHSNNIFAQNVRNILIMNNVFWNDNKKFTTGSGDNNSAVIRLLNYGASDVEHKVQNIGMYYNTMYLADGNNNEKVDFLIFGGAKQGQTAAWYDASTIDFKYNNCYSYSTQSSGKTSNSFIGLTLSGATTNNFWAKNGDYSFGTDKKNADMSLEGGIVCKTAPNTPEGMVIKGDGMNFGIKVTDDKSGLGAEKQMSDRLKLDARPEEGTGWTLGAYQYVDPSKRETLHKIIWNGAAGTDWDNRGNWVKEDGSQITCVDNLADDLEVVIPAPNSTKYPLPAEGVISNYPTIPEWSAPEHEEEVRSDLSSGGNKFASQISVEYGGSLLGVEKLGERYEKVSTSFIAGRSEWILVGSVVKPFDENGEPRLVQSGDYFIANHEPHVYMQHVEQSGNDVVTGTPFTSLEENVGLQSAFMIRIPDQYGPNKTPASYYYKRTNPNPAKLGDGTVSKQFDFVGRFSADADLPQYTGLKTGSETFNFVNNYYPANLNIYQDLGSDFDAKYYDYESKSWKPVVKNETYIKPQNGYVLISKNTATTFTPTHYVTGNTAYLKSVDAADMIELKLYNNSDGTNSVIYIKSDGSNSYKAFGLNETTPELYVLDNSNMYDVFVPSEKMTRIPLGVKNISTGKYSVRFALESVQGFDEVMLEDALTNQMYDLTIQDQVITGIATGTTEGRFFLNFGAGEEELPTDDDPVADENSSISIFAAEDGTVVISAPLEENLISVEITDLGGVTRRTELKDVHYNRIKLSGVKGAYIIKALGETQSKTAKVIVK